MTSNHFHLYNHKSLFFRHTHALTRTPFHNKVATLKTSLVRARHTLTNASDSRQNQTWRRSNSVTSTRVTGGNLDAETDIVPCVGMYLQHKKGKKNKNGLLHRSTRWRRGLWWEERRGSRRTCEKVKHIRFCWLAGQGTSHPQGLLHTPVGTIFPFFTPFFLGRMQSDAF